MQAKKNWNNLEIRICPVTDGIFTLYEDELDNNNYEKGAFSEITFLWNDRSHILTMRNRNGRFQGMMQNPRFYISMISNGSNPAEATFGKVNKTVNYSGKELKNQILKVNRLPNQ